MTDATCRGITKAGQPCRVSMNLSAGGLCLAHDPERREAARQTRIAGGVAAGQARRERRAKLPPASDVPKVMRTLDDAVRWSSWAADQVARGSMDARSAHEIAVLVREFRQTVEKRDLQHEVARLQKRLAMLEKHEQHGTRAEDGA